MFIITLVTCLICSLLSKLSADDEGAFQIRQCNGVYLLGRLLTDTHALHVSKRMDDILQSMLEIQTHTFRALRFVFSSERNRKLFKCIFPANLYEIFIDVGHYRHDIGEYRHVAQNWCDLTPDIVRRRAPAPPRRRGRRGATLLLVAVRSLPGGRGLLVLPLPHPGAVRLFLGVAVGFSAFRGRRLR